MNTQRLCKRNLEKTNRLDTPRLNEAFYKAKVLLTIFAQFLGFVIGCRNVVSEIFVFKTVVEEIIRHQD